jgi:hypothetical protein
MYCPASASDLCSTKGVLIKEIYIMVVVVVEEEVIITINQVAFCISTCG